MRVCVVCYHYRRACRVLQNTDLSQYLERHSGGLNPRNIKVSGSPRHPTSGETTRFLWLGASETTRRQRELVLSMALFSSVCISPSVDICPSASVRSFVSVRPSVCLRLSIRPSICPSVRPFVRSFVRPSVHASSPP